MPLRLDIRRQLSARSDRVKSVDMHPTEPWVLAALYNGKGAPHSLRAPSRSSESPAPARAVYIWNYNTQDVVKQFEITDLPVRAAKFVVRKQWVVAGSDDMFVTVRACRRPRRRHCCHRVLCLTDCSSAFRQLQHDGEGEALRGAF